MPKTKRGEMPKYLKVNKANCLYVGSLLKVAGLNVDGFDVEFDTDSNVLTLTPVLATTLAD